MVPGSSWIFIRFLGMSGGGSNAEWYSVRAIRAPNNLLATAGSVDFTSSRRVSVLAKYPGGGGTFFSLATATNDFIFSTVCIARALSPLAAYSLTSPIRLIPACNPSLVSMTVRRMFISVSFPKPDQSVEPIAKNVAMRTTIRACPQGGTSRRCAIHPHSPVRVSGFRCLPSATSLVPASRGGGKAYTSTVSVSISIVFSVGST